MLLNVLTPSSAEDCGDWEHAEDDIDGDLGCTDLGRASLAGLTGRELEMRPFISVKNSGSSETKNNYAKISII